MVDPVHASSPVLLVVAAAIANGAGHWLLQKRPSSGALSGLWEFPGGKVEIGETPENALIRELGEELGIAVVQEDIVPLSFATGKAGNRDLILLLYRVSAWQGEIGALHADEIDWFDADAMGELPMPPADYPLIECVRRAAERKAKFRS